MSTCGSALPLAIGAAVATGGPVLAVVGDGSLGYHVSEFETISRLNLPVVCVVGNNHAWGLEYNLQAALYGSEYVVASRLGEVHFASVASAMGVRSYSVATLNELELRVRESLADAVPTLIEVQVTLAPSPLTQAVINKDGQV
jgi:acetolactate synthase-1/2/3 large subunit